MTQVLGSNLLNCGTLMLDPTEASAGIFRGPTVPQGVVMAAKSPPGSHWKELVEGTQRKAGVFAFTINNLRAEEEVSLLKMWKGDGTFTRISLRAFLGKGWRMNETISFLHCNSANGSGVLISLGEIVVSFGKEDVWEGLAADLMWSWNGREEVAASLSAWMEEAK